ncbi:NADP-dependent oxidoreductase [Enhygromyxa salina]|uniref:Quinone oxidoreductase 1 n=1 Tax=Enhygromyxa salina TaxID=215803 RepID=A0A2S9YPF3_9BACT|nr:NADP-dependent oxidoreductase [Enhygromyxa salina]PRQ06939.1 Quinone oxidoreductase 1 [Enhygromyxa salina]
MNQMLAAYIERFGGDEVVRVEPRPIPEVGPSQVLIAVHAAAVNPRDWLLRDGRYVFRSFVVGFPKVLGSDVAGVVAAVGPRVSRFRPGDEVVAMQTTLGQMGGFAEYMAVHERAVAHEPRSADHAHCAGLGVAGLTALQALRDDVGLRGHERVAILGASGGVGHYAVQVGKYLGAQVIGVCSGANHAWVRELGADEVIDYRTQDVVGALAASGGVDVVFDAIGKSSLERVRGCLRAGGRYVSTVPTGENARDQLRSTPTQLLGMPGGLVSRMVLCRSRGADLAVLASMVDAGGLRTVIDSVYPLAQTRDALARSRTQRARGKIILAVRS